MVDMSESLETRRLRDIIADQCEAKEIRLDELAKKSGLASGYMDALMSDVRSRIPAFPYVRLHLIKMAEILGLPSEALVDAYRRDFVEKFSGASDTLPANRFALPSLRRMHAGIGGAIVVLALLYLLVRGLTTSGSRLTIEMPPADQSVFSTSSSTILLAGKAGASDTVMINNQEIAVAADGTFSYEYPLSPEMNLITFSVKRFLGGKSEVVRRVFYDEPLVPALKAGPPKEEAEERLTAPIEQKTN